MPATMEIHELAAEAYGCFETATRPDGSSFARVRDGSPEWVSELVREAHGRDADGAPSFLPDDWRYATIRSALAFIGDDATDPDEDAHVFADSQADVYTGELIAWMGSNLQRVGYVDQAVAEFGFDEERGVVGAIGMGQYLEAREVYELVRGALEERAAALEDADG
jgi:hypothetical protein